MQIVEAPPAEAKRWSETMGAAAAATAGGGGGCGNLKLYLPYASNDFSPPLARLPVVPPLGVHPPDVCADLHSPYLALIYLFVRVSR